jgi:hypothetical protein
MIPLHSQPMLSHLAGERLKQYRVFAVEADEISRGRHTIFAMSDGYIDLRVTEGTVNSGVTLFRLNDAELDLESFRLQQQQLLAGIIADRLSNDYVQKLIILPLTRAVDFAAQDLENARYAEGAVRGDLSSGQINPWSREAMDNAGIVDQRNILLTKAQADLVQKQIEIDAQRRRLNAELQDLAERIVLNAEIRKLHQYSMPQRGEVQFQTFGGAFLKKRDPICTVEFN